MNFQMIIVNGMQMRWREDADGDDHDDDHGDGDVHCEDLVDESSCMADDHCEWHADEMACEDADGDDHDDHDHGDGSL